MLSSGKKNDWGMFHNGREIEQVGTGFKCEVLFSSVSSPGWLFILYMEITLEILIEKGKGRKFGYIVV